MAKTIGNPLSWTAQVLGSGGKFAVDAVNDIGGEKETAVPDIRPIGIEDIRIALRKGAADFSAFRTDVILIVFLYPVIGLVLAWFSLDRNLVPLVFPLISGFALIGPVAAIGLYEMSRRRERGDEVSWFDAFSVLRSPSIGSIFALGVYLAALFFLWMVLAIALYDVTLGPEPPASLWTLVHEALTTGPGWTMIIAGCVVGGLLAVLALIVSFISFPLLIDRHIGLPRAVATSFAVARQSPGTVAMWGLLVAVGLVLGSIPALLGLIIVMPILGHATWHLYRQAVPKAP